MLADLGRSSPAEAVPPQGEHRGSSALLLNLQITHAVCFLIPNLQEIFPEAQLVSGQITSRAHVCCPEIFPLCHMGPHPGGNDEVKLGFGSQG